MSPKTHCNINMGLKCILQCLECWKCIENHKMPHLEHVKTQKWTLHARKNIVWMVYGLKMTMTWMGLWMRTQTHLSAPSLNPPPTHKRPPKPKQHLATKIWDCQPCGVFLKEFNPSNNEPPLYSQRHNEDLLREGSLNPWLGFHTISSIASPWWNDALSPNQHHKTITRNMLKKAVSWCSWVNPL